MGTTLAKSITISNDDTNKDDTAATTPTALHSNDTTKESMEITTSATKEEAPLSKNARKRKARLERLAEKRQSQKAERRAFKAQKAIEKRKDRDDYIKTLSPEQVKDLLEHRTETLHKRQLERRTYRDNLRSGFKSAKYTVCVDLDDEWTKEMQDKERKSLCRQLMYAYNSLKKCALAGQVPLNLIVCGLNSDMIPYMDSTANGWQGWPVKIHENCMDKVIDLKKIVYLTADADEVLDEINEDDVYVIGGIVDRNRLKNATLNKAKTLGVRCKKFNLDASVILKCGTKVLTVNHCVDIVMHRAHGLSWNEAYMKVLPERKGLESVAVNTAVKKDGEGDSLSS